MSINSTQHTINVSGADHLPAAAELIALASHFKVIHIEFPVAPTVVDGQVVDPSLSAKLRLIEELRSALPDYRIGESFMLDLDSRLSVRDNITDAVLSGSSTIFMLWVATEAQIEPLIPMLAEAATEFRSMATSLMTRLCEQLEVDPQEFTDPQYWNSRFFQTGDLDDSWRRFFHGYECRFMNRYTGQDIDVRLGFAAENGKVEFGVLDPGFFRIFLQTTPQFRAVADALDGEFKNISLALQILSDRGYLRQLNDAYDHSGWLAGGRMK